MSHIERSHRFSRFASVAALLCLLAGPAAAAEEMESQLAAAHNAFGFRLFETIGKEPGNIVLSPYSTGTMMELILLGARGATADQIREVAGFKFPDLPQGDLAPAHNVLATVIAESATIGEIELDTANAIMVREDKSNIAPEFIERIKADYQAELLKGTDPKVINEWVAKKTRDKIPTLFDKLPQDWAAVLANAIYFSGTWEHEFPESATADAPFHLAADKSEPVKTMRAEGDYALVEEKDYRAISVPYRRNSMLMVIVLPTAVDGLAAVVEAHAKEGLPLLAQKLAGEDPVRVKLALPRFKADYSVGLVDPLKSMGLDLPFGDKADFSGMSKDPLAISDMVHKALIEVDETGTKAAAASGTIVVTRSVPTPSDAKEFTVDRPFLFMLAERTTGAVLFMGRIADPKN